LVEAILLGLNNILHQILYPKGGDSTYLGDDSSVVLDCFGDEFTKFSISHYIWDKIYQASEDAVRHFPYAPYIMHIIEQLSDIKFPTNAPHIVLKISNKMSHKARKEMEDAATARASTSRAHASPPTTSRSRHAASEEPPNKFKFFMNYMFGACCASAQCEHDMQERMYRIE
jgi:hypothetical protein